jgi:hypothetical protein
MSCYTREACRNYALFHELPLEAVEPERVARSFGGLEGWAAVTRKDLFPECLSELEDALADGAWCDRRLLTVAEDNKSRLRGAGERPSSLSSLVGHSCDIDPLRLQGEVVPPLINRWEGGGAWEETLRWSLPTFSLAKEGYERFKGLSPGRACLREVLRSSAGMEGWLAFERGAARAPDETKRLTTGPVEGPEGSSEEEGAFYLSLPCVS